MSGKYALIIGNTEYGDPGLSQLTAPGKDARDFGQALKDKKVGAFDEVRVLYNEPEHVVREAIDDFFNNKKPDDLLVFYFSGHGVRDELGALYLAVKNTIRAKLRATGIKSDFIREAMDQSRSRRQVLILDCCNSGAFSQGTKAATGASIGTASAFEAGYGRIILTASDSTQYAWEGDKVIGETENSLFTHFLVEGLKGEADLNGDGHITVDELYDYAYEKVKQATPKQTPSKFSSKQQGEIVLRQNIRIEDARPAPLPDDLTAAIHSSLMFVREGAVRQLEDLLKGKNIGLARSARLALEKMAREDDSRAISKAAEAALKSVARTEDSAPPEKLAPAADVRVPPASASSADPQPASSPARPAPLEKLPSTAERPAMPKPAQARPAAPVVSRPTKSPVLAFTLSLIFGGVGQWYLGQVKKGIVLTVAIVVTFFIVIGVIINFASAVDAYAIAKKINAGRSVGEWEFGFDWKAALASLILAGLSLLAFGIFTYVTHSLMTAP